MSENQYPKKPDTVRTITFIDGQNLYRQAKRCFGYYWPNYDPIKLSEKIGKRDFSDRNLVSIRFYTGIPPLKRDRLWRWFWDRKLREHSHDPRFHSFTRDLVYHKEEVKISSPSTGKTSTEIINVAREKGIDVRIALDIVDLAYKNEYDAAVIFSQDGDLSEAVKDLQNARNILNRWIYIESAFPVCDSIPKHQKRGIPNTNWVKINKSDYDACSDPNDYRPPESKTLHLFSF